MTNQRLVSNLAQIISNEECAGEDRIDAAIALIRADKQLAEEIIVRVLENANSGQFDFQSELIDVILGEWATQNRSTEAKLLISQLPEDVKSYAEKAWWNLTGLDRPS